MSNNQLILDENNKDISHFSFYDSNFRNEDKNIKDKLQAELDYLNSSISSFKLLNTKKNLFQSNIKKDNHYQSQLSSKLSYTESITESIPNNSSKEDYYSYDSKSCPIDDVSFSSFNKQLNNNCNELESKLIKVCSGILSDIDENSYKENNNEKLHRKQNNINNNDNKTQILNQKESADSNFSSVENKILSKTIPSLFKQGPHDLKNLRKKIQDPSSSSNTNSHENDKQSDTTSVSRVSQFFNKNYQSAVDNISQYINRAMENNYSESNYTSFQFLPSSQEGHPNQDNTSYSTTNTRNGNTSSTSTITQRKVSNNQIFNNSVITEETNYSKKEDININPYIPRDYSKIIDFGSELNFSENQSITSNDNQSYLGTFTNDNFSNSIKSLINEIDRLKTNFKDYYSLSNYSHSKTSKNLKNQYREEKDDETYQDVLYLDSLYDDITRTNTITNQSQSYASKYFHQYYRQDNPQSSYSSMSFINESNSPSLYFDKETSSTTDSEIRKKINQELNSNSLLTSNDKTDRNISINYNINNSNHDHVNNLNEMKTTEDHEFQYQHQLIQQKIEKEKEKKKKKIDPEKQNKTEFLKFLQKNSLNNSNKSTLNSSRHYKRIKNMKNIGMNNTIEMNRIYNNHHSEKIYQNNIYSYNRDEINEKSSNESNSLLIKYDDDTTTNDIDEEDYLEEDYLEEEKENISDSNINTNILLNTNKRNSKSSKKSDIGSEKEKSSLKNNNKCSNYASEVDNIYQKINTASNTNINKKDRKYLNIGNSKEPSTRKSNEGNNKKNNARLKTKDYQSIDSTAKIMDLLDNYNYKLNSIMEDHDSKSYSQKGDINEKSSQMSHETISTQQNSILKNEKIEDMILKNAKLANKIKNMKQKIYLKEQNIQLSKELDYLRGLAASSSFLQDNNYNNILNSSLFTSNNIIDSTSVFSSENHSVSSKKLNNELYSLYLNNNNKNDSNNNNNDNNKSTTISTNSSRRKKAIEKKDKKNNDTNQQSQISIESKSKKTGSNINICKKKANTYSDRTSNENNVKFNKDTPRSNNKSTFNTNSNSGNSNSKKSIKEQQYKAEFIDQVNNNSSGLKEKQNKVSNNNFNIENKDNFSKNDLNNIINHNDTIINSDNQDNNITTTESNKNFTADTNLNLAKNDSNNDNLQKNISTNNNNNKYNKDIPNTNIINSINSNITTSTSSSSSTTTTTTTTTNNNIDNNNNHVNNINNENNINNNYIKINNNKYENNSNNQINKIHNDNNDYNGNNINNKKNNNLNTMNNDNKISNINETINNDIPKIIINDPQGSQNPQYILYSSSSGINTNTNNSMIKNATSFSTTTSPNNNDKNPRILSNHGIYNYSGRENMTTTFSSTSTSQFNSNPNSTDSYINKLPTPQSNFTSQSNINSDKVKYYMNCYGVNSTECSERYNENPSYNLVPIQKMDNQEASNQNILNYKIYQKEHMNEPSSSILNDSYASGCSHSIPIRINHQEYLNESGYDSRPINPPYPSVQQVYYDNTSDNPLYGKFQYCGKDESNNNENQYVSFNTNINKNNTEQEQQPHNLNLDHNYYNTISNNAIPLSEDFNGEPLPPSFQPFINDISIKLNSLNKINLTNDDVDFNSIGNDLNEIKQKYNNTIIHDINDLPESLDNNENQESCNDIQEKEEEEEMNNNSINQEIKYKRMTKKKKSKKQKSNSTKKGCILKHKSKNGNLSSKSLIMPNKRVISCMKDIPFLPASSKYSCKSYSIFANVQKVFSLIKDHNVRRCSVCRKHQFNKHKEVKQILHPKPCKEKEPIKNTSFQSMCTCSEELLKLLQLYNNEYEKNINTYNNLLLNIQQYNENQDFEKITDIKSKILNLYQYLKKKSNEMLMIKYLIESLPSNDYGQKNSSKNTSSSTITTKRKGYQVNTKLHSHKNSSFKWKRMNSVPSSTTKRQTLRKASNNTTIPPYHLNLSSSYPNSTLELLKFSQCIQEFLTNEHNLRTFE
ncbi:hypothetical protein BCR36DRAFT_416299 [Piromyces finnis]|uniref:Uncharacterized protein n=1 Tax=Piromyces finnis TaxID=1754191 RepID=A0A1Y1UVQ1_9FUNG|nr:hypothetical protein BCR36DRAFT_416299 [Piromyces finnis]|eukprot:ORX42080.1 hypothetical protein BCR36DRAFT_416299 [Piromyces finnis]